ncbi:acetyl-CoA acetyltransferase [Klebsiella variicola]|nr:acetyl-CoA acetyltransferase [Klebsiella variicola]
MALLLAGLPESVPGSTINRLCGSSLDAIGVAARAIKSGETQLMIAGGVESMSRAPFVMGKAESAFSRSMQMEDTTIGWRFINPQMKALYGVHSMPETAENVADEFAISRADQDAFALRSQLRTAAAQEAGRFADELIAVQVPQRKGEPLLFSRDEHPRSTSLRRWLNCAAWCAPTAASPPVTPPALTMAPVGCCWPARRRWRLTIFNRWPGWSAWRRRVLRRGSWALAGARGA